MTEHWQRTVLLKRKLYEVIEARQPRQWPTYWGALQLFAVAKLSKAELDDAVLRALGEAHVPLHNAFIAAVARGGSGFGGGAETGSARGAGAGDSQAPASGGGEGQGGGAALVSPPQPLGPRRLQGGA